MSSAITHHVQVQDLNAHLYRITLTVPHPAQQQQIAMPVWIPGSYMVREFSKQVQSLSAWQDGHKIALQQRDKCTWELRNTDVSPVTVQYDVYAFDNSVRTAYLDTQRGFFNGTSLFMRVIGQESATQLMEIATNPLLDLKKWRVATALNVIKISKVGWGTYQASDYDELVDSPVEMGEFWQGTFTERGIPHRFIVSGAAPTFDGERLLADTQKIVATALNFWHGASPINLAKNPDIHNRYVFMLNVVDDGYGGLEHRHSTALIAKRGDLPRLQQTTDPEGYVTLLGLISHEYFHTWNVKRLRPTELASYDYTRENHTAMLWFFEGFTSYYDDLLLRRAGLIGDSAYLSLLAKTINQVQQTPGRKVHALADASFEAWTKYYRPDENSANSTVSYYTKGALVALCLDLLLRCEGKSTLDEVMRALWKRSHSKSTQSKANNGVMSEADLLDVLQSLGGRSFQKEIKAWVHGIVDLPLSQLLTSTGVDTVTSPAALAQQMGMRVQQSQAPVERLVVKSVLTASMAAKSGFSAGDEWLAVDDWRVTSLEDVKLVSPQGKSLIALVSRGKKLVRLRFNLPKDALGGADIQLKVVSPALLNQWLTQ